MSRFVDYTKNTDFTAWQTSNPGQPHSGANLDSEYDEIETIIGGVNDNAQLIQREDGALANGVVTPDSFSQGALNLVGGDWTPQGEWVTATAYVSSDVVSNSGTTYVCNTAHTSAAAFDTDNAAGYWTVIAGLANLFAKATGTADALAVTIDGLPGTIADGTTVGVRALLANTGAATITVNTEPARAIKRIGGVALQAGNIRAEDHDLLLRYNSGNTWWELMNPAHHLDQVLPVANKINYYDGSAANGQLSVGAYGQTAIAWSTVAAARTSLGVASAGAQHSLTELLNPEVDAGWGDIYRGGWAPAWMNQQWGGAQWGGLPDGSAGDVATGYLNSDSTELLGSAAATTWVAQAFKVSEAQTVAAVWLRIDKVGSPVNATEPLEVHIASSLDDGAGTTVVTNGTATTVDGQTLSADAEWVRFEFSTPPSLSADTAYYLVGKATGADGSNHFALVTDDGGHSYPHGNMWVGDDATPANWTEDTTEAFSFLVETGAATRFLRTGGQFDGLLEMTEGAPLNQSKGLIKPLSDFMDSGVGTLLIRGEDYTKDKTIADLTMGALDHDRILLRCNVTTGYAQVDIYETDGTVQTVSGTSTDLSDGSFHDVAIRWRSKADGSDYVSLYVDGAEEGTPIASATITLAAALEQQGHCWLGGGFPAAVTWDEDEDMSALPSAGNWTWTGTGTEANAMVVSGGQLFQNGAGYASTHSGYYTQTVTLSNANGWIVQTRMQVKNDPNTITTPSCGILIDDGAKNLRLEIKEYFIEVLDTSAAIGYIQQDMTDRAHEITVIGKLSDFYVFIDGWLAFDGAGLLDEAVATNRLWFGDWSTTAGKNATAVWDYMKYYDAAWVTPEHCGGKISQVAHWAVDQTSLLEELWGSGTPQSVKELAGVKDNYITERRRNRIVYGVQADPTTTSTSLVSAPQMAIFDVLAGDVNFHFNIPSRSSVVGPRVSVGVASTIGKFTTHSSLENEASYTGEMQYTGQAKFNPGMHLFEGQWSTSGGTLTNTVVTESAREMRHLKIAR